MVNIDVWQLDLRLRDADALDVFYQDLLAPEERIRADRFHFPVDRRRWIVAHAGMRRILSRYLATEPGLVHFDQDANGKPFLVETGEGASGLHFNLSHSRDLAVLAVGSAELGVDVEYGAGIVSVADLLGEVCSDGERLALLALPEPDRREAFLRLWTRKEAFLKGLGLGLNVPPRDCAFPVGPVPAGVRPHVAPALKDATAWHVFDLVLADRSYLGALACQDAAPDVRSWCWSSTGSP
ncbi:MAG: 4'-phosphopantetheinyl transferase superfamily protein [Methylotetracoccus sp.]